MSKIAIVTDSTAYLPAELREKYQITVTSQVLLWDGEALKDGVDIQPEAFYRRLQTAKNMPTTSQVAIPDMQRAFSSLLDQGYEGFGAFSLLETLRDLPISHPGAGRIDQRPGKG